MIDIEFESFHIQKEKESYELTDDRIFIGESMLAYKNVDGETYIQDNKIRKDGYIDRYALRLLVSYAERKVLRKIMFGFNKARRCNPATLTITDEGDRNTMVNVVSGDSSFYSENAVVENIDNIENHPSQYNYNEDDILYEIYILLIKSK
jgi:hypothetical protein